MMTTISELRQRQAEVAAYIATTLQRTGRPPSYGMIRERFGYADNTGVRQMVRRLEAKGVLRRHGVGRERRIRLMEIA